MRTTISRSFAAVAAGAALTIAPAGLAFASDHGSDKVFVCKYVGKPGEDERLSHVISVSVNSIPAWPGEIGSFFADRQGRSVVIAFDEGQNEPALSECPGTVTPPPTPKPTVTKTPKPTVTKTPKPTMTKTPKPTHTATQTATHTVTQTATHTATGTVTQTATGTVTQTATGTVTQTATGTVTQTATGTVTQTATGTVTHTATGTATHTASIARPATTHPTAGPVVETDIPTESGSSQAGLLAGGGLLAAAAGAFALNRRRRSADH